MTHFRKQLTATNPSPTGRRFVYVTYDQLSDELGPLSREPAEELGVVLIESAWKAGQRPYHKEKLAMVLANQRRFALEQAARGVHVDYRMDERPYSAVIEEVVAERGPLRLMRPAERELRVHLGPAVDAGHLDVLPHEGWLSDVAELSSTGGPPYRMDAFYRSVRRRTGILMEEGKPVGGRFSFDGENRKPWRGEPEAPIPPTFEVGDIEAEVGELIESRFSEHPGTLRLDRIPSRKRDAEALWAFALERCLPSFGPYEDAMSVKSRGLFHTRIAPLLNLHRLLPRRVVDDVASADLPLASREGFIRQVLGWREFVRHVHELTDGFRDLGGQRVATLASPGDGGYASWRGREWPKREPSMEGGATPSYLGAKATLPPAYWGKASGLHCLDTVVAEVWESGWTHHIPRLMVLSNLATLLDVSPRELTDWFWVAFTDAYDWVVEPNVLGMGTFAAGDVMTTKPYVSGAAYLHRMSDYCGGCAFDPKKSCPITSLYWAFLDRHEPELKDNPRLKLPLASMRKRGDERRAEDAEVFERVRRTLERGEKLEPT